MQRERRNHHLAAPRAAAAAGRPARSPTDLSPLHARRSRPAGALHAHRVAVGPMAPHRRPPAAARPLLPAAPGTPAHRGPPAPGARAPRPAAAAAAAAPGGSGSGSDSEAELMNPALASTDFSNIKVLDPDKVYQWLRRYQPFVSLSSEAVREIAEVRARAMGAGPVAWGARGAAMGMGCGWRGGRSIPAASLQPTSVPRRRPGAQAPGRMGLRSMRSAPWAFARPPAHPQKDGPKNSSEKPPPPPPPLPPDSSWRCRSRRRAKCCSA
jgi:hypothetical protein